jgi:hypothetical protein
MKKMAVAFVNSVFRHVEKEGIKEVKGVKKFGSVYKCDYHVGCDHLYKIELDPPSSTALQGILCYLNARMFHIQ